MSAVQEIAKLWSLIDELRKENAELKAQILRLQQAADKSAPTNKEPTNG